MKFNTNYATTSACQSLDGGDLKPWRSLLGIELQAMVLSVVCSCGTLALTRIHCWPREGARWTAAAVASSQAAAGARTHAGIRLRYSGKKMEGLGGTYGAAQARRSD